MNFMGDHLAELIFYYNYWADKFLTILYWLCGFQKVMFCGHCVYWLKTWIIAVSIDKSSRKPGRFAILIGFKCYKQSKIILSAPPNCSEETFKEQMDVIALRFMEAPRIILAGLINYFWNRWNLTFFLIK